MGFHPNISQLHHQARCLVYLMYTFLLVEDVASEGNCIAFAYILV
jgi:hypothetical protein